MGGLEAVLAAQAAKKQATSASRPAERSSPVSPASSATANPKTGNKKRKASVSPEHEIKWEETSDSGGGFAAPPFPLDLQSDGLEYSDVGGSYALAPPLDEVGVGVPSLE